MRLSVKHLSRLSPVDQGGLLDAARREVEEAEARGPRKAEGWAERRRKRIEQIHTELFGK